MNYISNRIVPAEGSPSSQIYIIGEAPGEEEDSQLKPFIGPAGDDLNRGLNSAGILRSECYVDNLYRKRPAANNFDYARNADDFGQSIRNLKDTIASNRPRVVVLCGSEPLRYLLDKTPKDKISKWRGSCVEKDGQLYYVINHPSFITRQRQHFPIFCHDFKRIKDVLSGRYSKPAHNFLIAKNSLQIHEAVDEILSCNQDQEITVDIETSKKDPTKIFCCGFGLSNSRAICLVNSDRNSLSLAFNSALHHITNSKLRLVYHNGYDFDTEAFYLQGISDRIDEDTFLAFRNLEPELPKSLAFLTSLYTWEPYYKDMADSDEGEDQKGWSESFDMDILYEYNCLDCITTFSVWKKLKELFNYEPLCFESYQFDKSLIPLKRELSRSGMLVDPERNQLLSEYFKTRIKKNSTVLHFLTGQKLNVNSKKEIPKLLYETLGLPIRKARDTKDKKGGVTADDPALVSLIAVAKGNANDAKTIATREKWNKVVQILKMIRIQRGDITNFSRYVKFRMSLDGRLRSSYKMGPETGRWSAGKYIDHSGLNSQTFPREVLEI